MDDSQPPAPDGVETCDSADMREHAPAPNSGPAALVAADLKRGGKDEGAAAAAATADGTATLPDEVMTVVFEHCDARTRMMVIPAVSKRWLRIGQRNAAIDLSWATTRKSEWHSSCTITDAGLAGLIIRFPYLQCVDLPPSCHPLPTATYAPCASPPSDSIARCGRRDATPLPPR